RLEGNAAYAGQASGGLPERLFGVHDLYGAFQALDREVIERETRLLCLGFEARAQMRRDRELIIGTEVIGARLES
ncbi:MAG: hypothetical protein WB610_00590, partial [Rhodomicrobium sp.]